MIGLDTSVLLRLLVLEPVEQAKRARKFLDTQFEKGERVWVSDLVISETYFALQYHYQVPKREAIQALGKLFESGEVIGVGTAASVLKTPNLHSINPGFVDRMIHADYTRDHGEMATFEKKARGLDRAQVL